MTIPGEAFPDDFDVAALMPPTPETEAAFEAAYAGITALGKVAIRHRSLEVRFGNGDQESSWAYVHCVQDTFRTVEDAEGVESTLQLGFYDSSSDRHEMLTDSQRDDERADPAFVESVVAQVSSGLGEGQLSWLRAAIADVHAGEELLALSADSLLNTSPYPVNETITRAAHLLAGNGTRIECTWPEEKADGFRNLPDLMHRDLRVQEPDGTEYLYMQQVNGQTNLVVKDAGERVRREISPITTDDDLDEVAIGRRALAAVLAEVDEVRALGLDSVTEGKLRKLATVIDEAMASGVTSTRPPQ
jgi:hypothetical protein